MQIDNRQENKNALVVGVLGYYHANNFGDEQYKEAFKELFSEAVAKPSDDILRVTNKHQQQLKFEFVNINRDRDLLLLKSQTENQMCQWDALIVGGGDLLNDHFLDHLMKICHLFKTTQRPNTTTTRNRPIIAFSIGIPEANTIETKCHKLFSYCDHIVVRNITDLIAIQKQYGTERVHYLPDAAFCWKQLLLSSPDHVLSNDSINSSIKNSPAKIPKKNPRHLHIGISTIPSERKFLSQFAELLMSWLEKIQKKSTNEEERFTRFHISIIPFDHSSPTLKPENSDLDDASMLSKYIQIHKQSQKSRIPLIVSIVLVSNMKEMLAEISKQNLMLVMRFHAHIFSLLCKVPFVSLSGCRKVTQLLDELPFEVPRFSLSSLSNSNSNKEQQTKFHMILDNLIISKIVLKFQEECHQLCLFRATQLEVAKRYKLSKWISSSSNVSIRDQLDFSSPTDTSLTRGRSTKVLEECWKRFVREYDESRLPLAETKTVLERFAAHLCFAWTGESHSKYFYGTVENLLDRYKQKNETIEDLSDWVYSDILENKKVQTGHLIDWNCNLSFQSKERSDVHRAGWSFVSDYLKAFSREGGLICDTYMDRTFLWNHDQLLHRGVIPYSQPWIGFLHHTPYDRFCSHNAFKIFSCKTFVLSLSTCVAIVVLSDSLAHWVKIALDSLSIAFSRNRKPAVISLLHPTEFTNCIWSPIATSFHYNLISIGSWYRNPWIFYKLRQRHHDHDKTEDFIQFNKLALKGLNMDENFPPFDRNTQKICLISLADADMSGGEKLVFLCCSCAQENRNELPSFESIMNFQDGQNHCDWKCQSCRPDQHSAHHHHHHHHHHDHGHVEIFVSKAHSQNQWMIYLALDLVRKARKHSLSGRIYLAIATQNESNILDANHDTTINKSAIKFLSFLEKQERKVQAACKSVEILQHVNNHDYDSLLARSVVFLCLHDASAVNTVIECIVRRTPLIVNRLPALEQYLGLDYPGFYDGLSDLRRASSLAHSRQSILTIHSYLSRKVSEEPTSFQIDHFLRSLSSHLIQHK